MGSIKINQEGFRNSSNSIFNFSVLYLRYGFLYWSMAYSTYILEYRVEYGTVHFIYTGSMEFYTGVWHLYLRCGFYT